MTNVNNTSGKSDGKLSRYEPENYIGFKLFVGFLVLSIIGLAIFFATH